MNTAVEIRRVLGVRTKLRLPTSASRTLQLHLEGKVESSIKCVNRSRWGEEFPSLDHLSSGLLEGIVNVIDQSLQDVIHRKPVEMSLEETVASLLLTRRDPKCIKVVLRTTSFRFFLV